MREPVRFDQVLRNPAVLLAMALTCNWPAVAAGPITDEEIAALYARSATFGSIPRDQWIAESKNSFAFRDINPKAPVHVLVAPKRRIPTMLQAPEDLLGEMLGLARRVAEQEGIARDGFRIVINTHPQGGQGIYHLHLHVLGGRPMKWPPG